MDETASESPSGIGLGGIIALAIFSVPALICLVKAARSGTPSRRFAFLSALCGFLLLAQVEFILDVHPPSIGALLIGVVRALVCGAGVVYVFRALIQRRRDRGVGVLGPVLSLLLNGLHGLYAFSLFLAPQAEAVVKGEPWVYKSEEDQVELTLPSEVWVRERLPDSIVGFRCRILPVKLGVTLDRESLPQFVNRETVFRFSELPNLRAGAASTGRTSAGDEYFMGGGYENRLTKEVLVHVVYVHRPARNQTVSFLSEATLTTKSEEKRAEQETAIREAVLSIARSLR